MTFLTDIEFAPNRATVAADNFRELERRIQGHTHIQTVPASTWNVAHNLGYRPTAHSVWIDETIHAAALVFVDENNLQVIFNANKTGVFKCA